MLEYFLAVLAGIGFAVAVTTDRRLSAQGEVAECPAMESGAWLRRRYIEAMGIAAVTTMAIVVYGALNLTSLGPLVLGAVVFSVGRELTGSLDSKILERHGDSMRTSKIATESWLIRRLRSRSRAQLERSTWTVPSLYVIPPGVTVATALGLKDGWLALVGWVPACVLVFLLLARNRKSMVAIVLAERFDRTRPSVSAARPTKRAQPTNTARRDAARRAKRRRRK